jgi:hypothetical protein
MAATTAPPPELQYAPPLRWHRRPVARRFIALALAALPVAAAAPGVPRARAHLTVLQAQQRCMTYSAPPATVVYERPWDRMSPVTTVAPSDWVNLYPMFYSPGLISQGTIFLHELKNPVGSRLLVAVDVTPLPTPSPSSGDGVVLVWRVIGPGSLLREPRLVNTGTHNIAFARREGTVRLYAASLDPREPSHFTFVCESGEKRLLFDGWLRADNSVVIEPRPEAPAATLPAPASPALLPSSGGSGKRGWPFRVSRSSRPTP